MISMLRAQQAAPEAVLQEGPSAVDSEPGSDPACVQVFGAQMSLPMKLFDWALAFLFACLTISAPPSGPLSRAVMCCLASRWRLGYTAACALSSSQAALRCPQVASSPRLSSGCTSRRPVWPGLQGTESAAALQLAPRRRCGISSWTPRTIRRACCTTALHAVLLLYSSSLRRMRTQVFANIAA